jgi:ABC-2 type transport system permease protein
MGSLKFLIRKEIIQFRRNKFLPRLIFAFPVVIMLVAPLIANMDVKGVKLAVVDADRSELSGRIRSHLGASDNLSLRLVTDDYHEAFSLLEAGKADVILSIPAGFERSFASGQPEKIKVDANAVNATRGTLGAQYAVMAAGSALKEMNPALQAGEMSVRYFYNETLDYRFYMIPAFIVILILLVCCFIPALNLVQEKEKGTIEQINVTPVSKLDFTLSKLVPYWIIGLVVITEAILTVGLVYGLWPAGNIGGIYLAAFLFALAMSGFAVTVANFSDTLQQSIFVMFFFVMLFMLMGGLLTPIGSMPAWAQWVTQAFPTRHFIAIMRSLYLKGTTVAELGGSYLGLIILGIFFSVTAMASYRKQE